MVLKGAFNYELGGGCHVTSFDTFTASLDLLPNALLALALQTVAQQGD